MPSMVTKIESSFASLSYMTWTWTSWLAAKLAAPEVAWGSRNEHNWCIVFMTTSAQWSTKHDAFVEISILTPISWLKNSIYRVNQQCCPGKNCPEWVSGGKSRQNFHFFLKILSGFANDSAKKSGDPQEGSLDNFRRDNIAGPHGPVWEGHWKMSTHLSNISEVICTSAKKSSTSLAHLMENLNWFFFVAWIFTLKAEVWSDKTRWFYENNSNEYELIKRTKQIPNF